MSNNFFIVDIETQNRLYDKKLGFSAWDNSKAVVCCLGVAVCNKHKINQIIQIVKLKENENTFADECKALLDDISQKGDMYAFNSKFDIAGIKNLTQKIYNIKDIVIKEGVHGKKKYWFERLKKLNPNIEDIYDPFYDNSGLCPDNYEAYLKTNDLRFIENIKLHNLNCLKKEWLIFVNKELLADNFKKIIFVNREKIKTTILNDFSNTKNEREIEYLKFIEKNKSISNEQIEMLKKIFRLNWDNVKKLDNFELYVKYKNSFPFLVNYYNIDGNDYITFDRDLAKKLIKFYDYNYFS